MLSSKRSRINPRRKMENNGLKRGCGAWLFGLLVGGAMCMDGVGESKAGYVFLGGVSVGQPVRGVAVIIAKKSFFCLENQKKNVYLHLRAVCG